MPNLRLLLDERKKNSDDTYPIKLRVSGYNDYKRYKTKFSATELDFEKLQSGKHLSDAQRKTKSSMDYLRA
ncbi:hypothetical protein SAMN04488023_12469 [Pedobacter rhizosphaerae]|uniref:Phage integrase SAM-like domain-containing protein n=1 Tax=Pedobacter rhizosphaerae TaxID=390241 RepID=A0A1H9TSY2_9SPHI|nr:hypothetical protein SAMN04488023_12469 [Pedobacter rhizosphaerae]